MMLGFLDQLRLATGLPLEEAAWFAGRAERRKLGRGDSFCRIGQERHEFAILQSGILQVYTLTSGGDRVVMDFIFAGMPALALDAAIRALPSEVEMEAVTPADMLVWPYELRLEAFERHAGWRRFEALCLEQAFIRKHRRYMSLRTETAEERFGRLAAELPADFRAIPQALIASYLNITPQYLSQLRRRNAKAATER